MHDFAIMLSIFITIYCFLDNIFKISDKITIRKSQDKNPANDSFLPCNSLSSHTYSIIISILFCIFTLYIEDLMGREAYRSASRLQRPETFYSRTKSDDLEKTSSETDDERYEPDQESSVVKKRCKFCHHHPNKEKCRYCGHKLRTVDKDVCKYCKHVRNEQKLKLKKSDEVDESREDSDYVKPIASPFVLKIGSKLFGSISKERTDDFEDEELDNRKTTYKKKSTQQHLETEETQFFLEIGDLFSPAPEESEIISPMDVESESGEEMPNGIEEEDIENMDDSGLDEQVDENIENIEEANLDEQLDIPELESPEANFEVYEQENLEQDQILPEQQMAYGDTEANGMQVNSFTNAQLIPQPQMVQQPETIQTQNPGNIFPQVDQETKLAIIQRFQNANIRNVKDFLNKLPDLLQQTPMNELRVLTEYCFVPLFRKLQPKDMENLLSPSTYYYLIGRSDNELIETFTNILEGLHSLPYASIKAFCDSHAAGYEQGTMAVDTYSPDMVVDQVLNRLKETGVLNDESINMASKGYRIGRCLMCSSEKFMNVLSGDVSNGLCDSCLSEIRRTNGNGGNLIDSLRGRSGNSRSIGGILGDVLDSSIGSSNGRIDSNGRSSTYSSGRYGQSEAENYERIRSSGEYSSGKGSSNGEGSFGQSLVAKGVELMFDKLSGNSSTPDGYSAAGNTTSGQMVLDANGNLVPAGSTPEARYGYIKDPATGRMRKAISAQEAASAVAAVGGANGMGGGMNGMGAMNGMGGGMNGMGAMNGMGRGMNGMGAMNGMGRGMNGMGAMNGMGGGMNGMGAMNGMGGGMNGMGAMNGMGGGMNGMGAMNGMGGGISGQMVLDANGRLVPVGSTPGAPYGYIKDPATGQMRPAKSAQEAASAVAAVGGANAALGAVGKTAGILGAVLNSSAVGNTVSGIANVASSIASAIGNVSVAKANNAMNQGVMNQNSMARQNGAMNQNGMAGQNGAMNQNGMAGQNGAMNQNGMAGQNGAMNQNGMAGQNGAMNQNGMAGQNRAMNQNGMAGQNGAMNQNGIAGQNGGAGTSSNAFTQAAAGATNAASTAANGQNGSASGTNNSTATNQQNAAAKQTSAQAQAAAQSEANQAAAAQQVAAAAQESASKKRRRKQR